MDYSGSVTNGRPAATSDSNPKSTEASSLPPSSTSTPPKTSTTDPVTSTTTNPTTDPSGTTSTTNDPPPTSTTTPPPSISTTTSPPPVISTTKEVATSTPVPIVTVTTSGTVVRTFTSTSYSSYITHVATAIPSQGGGEPGSTNVGAIAGGVVGGVAAIALIGFIVILLSRRRRNKNKKETSYESETGGAGGPINPHPFANNYNTYGTPTVISDNNSLPSSRPLSMSTAPSQGIKPRPFVQAYNPAYDDQHQQYAGYDGSQSPPQEHYYSDYNQAYNNNYNTNAYSHDAYYAHQQEPMIPISTSTTAGLSSGNPPHGRNVPDENDYDLTRKVSRHVPDEIN
ncbi:uncharacterized protein ATC70_004703 [Mucor velutinosus]|uniref:receptor protein-tyrosine kinase n=1 Tax=Mucor velutinosus TaxID=708070 RepID=A0AAN7D3Y7_9FUNG|nr:hypothetical protein ATC70_004703 [Mucor velutinosus]